MLKAWSKTLSVLALSSGEAELMSMVKASSEALGLRALYGDFGIDISIRIASDATAAIGMVGRLGLGKVRHLSVSDLWLQEKSRSGEIKFYKVLGAVNPSDAMTKPLDGNTLEAHLTRMGVVKLTGRADIAPKAKAH